MFFPSTQPTSCRKLEIRYGRRTYTTEIGNCYKTGLSSFLPSPRTPVIEDGSARHWFPGRFCSLGKEMYSCYCSFSAAGITTLNTHVMSGAVAAITTMSKVEIREILTRTLEPLNQDPPSPLPPESLLDRKKPKSFICLSHY